MKGDPVIEKDGNRYKDRSGTLVKVCDAEIVRGVGIVKCKNVAIRGSNFCVTHGGKPKETNLDTLKFNTGLKSVGRSRFARVGSQLLSRINELREDPELWSLRDDAAYITALIDNRAELAAEGVTVEQLHSIRKLYSQCESNIHSDDFMMHFRTLGDAINSVSEEANASKEVLGLIEKRTSIVEAEQRLLQTKAYTLEVDQAFSLVMQVVNIVKASVRNADEFAAIKVGIDKLLKVYDDNSDIIDAEVVDGTENNS